MKAKLEASSLEYSAVASTYPLSAVVSISSLTNQELQEMWDLFQQYYDFATFHKFKQDLLTKSSAFILRCPETNAVRGFSTIEIIHRKIDGKRVIIFYSGDTIIDKKYWGKNSLTTDMLIHLLKIKISHPFTPMYWFLISKGYKTYLKLSRNFTDYWPRHDQKTMPEFESNLLNSIATEKFNHYWDHNKGLIDFGSESCRLKLFVAPIKAIDLRQPDIKFFVESNPEFDRGVELACLGKFDFKACLFWTVRKVARMVSFSGR